MASSLRSVQVLSKDIFIVAAQRTACGTFGGTLKGVSATDLAVHSSRAAIAASDINPDAVDSAVFGNVQQTSSDASYLARHVALRSDVPIPAPALTVNRLCGSGFEAVIQGAKDILLGEAGVALAGGTESMSQAPYAVRDVRFGTRLGKDVKMEDTLWAGLTDQYCKTPMGMTAENLAEEYDITREDSDKFALSSQQKWKTAHDAGVFDSEIAPMEVKAGRKMVTFHTDEHPRGDTTLEQLTKLQAVFKEGGVVTAGSSSGICDGAASLIVADAETVETHNLKPLARIVGWSVAGVEPTVMGIGPVPAVQNLLNKAGRTIHDIDQVEVNEAFGAQCLAVAKALEIDLSKLNIHGGAIALGHPLGMSGARILTHLAHCLNKGVSKTALGSACIGGGQGIAVLLEAA